MRRLHGRLTLSTSLDGLLSCTAIAGVTCKDNTHAGTFEDLENSTAHSRSQRYVLLLKADIIFYNKLTVSVSAC